jgi:hypothetical protein
VKESVSLVVQNLIVPHIEASLCKYS